jgi:hypothetical protein
VSPSKIIDVFTRLHHSIGPLQNLSDTGSTTAKDAIIAILTTIIVIMGTLIKAYGGSLRSKHLAFSFTAQYSLRYYKQAFPGRTL